MKSNKCDNCHKTNNEYAVFNKKVLFIFTTKVHICQSCVSKAFRSFTKDK